MVQGKHMRGNVLDKLAALPANDYSVSVELPKKAEPVYSDEAYDPQAICGYCGRIAGLHPVVNSANSLDNCKRDPLIIGSATSYGDLLVKGYGDQWEDASDLDRYGLPKVDYSGPAINEDYDPWFVEFDSADNLDAIESYRDVNPNEHTVTLEEYRSGSSPELKADEIRNVFVEGHDGFMSLVMNDENLNRLLQERMLNIYRDRNSNRLRVGGIQFVPCVDGSIDARCVQHNCGQVLNSGLTQTRTEMEEFTYNVIRHGNNHSAKWFTTRPEFYKVHAHYCDLDCDPKTPGCSYANVAVPFAIPSMLTPEMVDSIARKVHELELTKAFDEGLAELLYEVNSRRSA